VVLQFAFSMVLMVCTLIIGQQNRYVQKKDVGFIKESIFSFKVKPPSNFFGEQPSYAQTLQTELERESSVIKVSSTSQPIYNVTSTHTGSLDWEGRAPDFEPRVAQFSIDETFPEVFDVELAEGRWFQPEYAMDSANVILNETAVKQFGIENPIGQRFSFRGADGQIVGVVKDFHYKSIHDPIAPMVIFRDAGWLRSFYVRFQTEQTAEALAAAQKLLAKHNPDLPFEPVFISEAYAGMYAKEAKTNRLFQLFAFLAIFISCLGLFGLITFHTERRGKEIGIRKILGASIASIIGLLGREFLLLIGISVFVAIPIAWLAMESWLENFAYKISIRWVFFVGGAFILLVIASLTVCMQAAKAALVNPIERLRSE
ncbi:MAG: ABC transporter permease, partial [Bacteroidota bacterium]